MAFRRSRYRPRALYARGRRVFRSRSYRRGGFGARFNVKFFAGMGLGVIAPNVTPYQDTIITALAVAPISLPYNLKMVAQGYVLGRIVKPFTAGFNPFAQSSTNTDFA